MKQNIREQLAVLENMTVAQLRDRYRDLFGENSRSGNRRWLSRRFAWRCQALAEGALPARMERLWEQAIANQQIAIGRENCPALFTSLASDSDASHNSRGAV